MRMTEHDLTCPRYGTVSDRGCKCPICGKGEDEFTNPFIKDSAATKDSIADFIPNKEEMNLIRQWYNAVKDLNPKYLSDEDDFLVGKINAYLGIAPYKSGQP